MRMCARKDAEDKIRITHLRERTGLSGMGGVGMEARWGRQAGECGAGLWKSRDCANRRDFVESTWDLDLCHNCGYVALVKFPEHFKLLYYF
jgi:hypothetical protein